MMHRFNVNWLLCLVCLFFYGCAHTATVKESLGNAITFSITFDAAPSFDTYSYYIIYADTSFTINTSANSNYFFLPGAAYVDLFVRGSYVLADYYTNYFSTWDGAIQLFAYNAAFTDGPFSIQSDDDHSSFSPTTPTLTEYRVNGSTITFTIDSNYLKITESSLYFSLVITKKTNANESLGTNILDMTTQQQGLTLIANQPIFTGTQDLTFFSGSGGAKLSSWSVSVY